MALRFRGLLAPLHSVIITVFPQLVFFLPRTNMPLPTYAIFLFSLVDSRWMDAYGNFQACLPVTFEWTIMPMPSILFRVICNLFLVLHNNNTRSKMYNITISHVQLMSTQECSLPPRDPRFSDEVMHLVLFSAKLIQWLLSCLDIQGQSARHHHPSTAVASTAGFNRASRLG